MVTRLGPDRKPIPDGTVVGSRHAPAGLEVTIRLRKDAEGTDTAAEIADDRPSVAVVLQPLSSDPATFKARARVHALALSTLADPGDDAGRVLSIDGNPLTAPELADPAPRMVKPPVIKAAEDLLTEVGAGSSWWANTGRAGA